jgi:uncharacterized membrane protein
MTVIKNQNRKRKPDPRSSSTDWTGIYFLPSPAILGKYNSVIPGLAERIVAQAEQQTQHRIEMERKVIISNIFRSWLGLVLGFLSTALGIGGGMFLTYKGFNVIGIMFSSATLVTIVMSFIYGSQSRKNGHNLNGNSDNSPKSLSQLISSTEEFCNNNNSLSAKREYA